MKHIVSFSTGLSSALATERVLRRYGHASAEVIFEDTTIEDADNYRFMHDMERRWGITVTALREGRSPYQVFSAQHVIPNSRVAPCTRRLKIEPFVAYLRERSESLTVHVGYDFSEMHRCGATQANYQALGWDVDFPLLWQPIEYRPYPDVCRQDWGIEPPRMYSLGYSHANCGGVCIKQGNGDWIRTLIHYPERYAIAEDWEATMRENPTNANYAILKDRRDGTMRPLTLRELRQRHEGQRPGQAELNLLDEQTGGCLYCGVGDLCESGGKP